ncbi:MAG: NB-ARC domain-containing protein [Planktothrix sp. GU0601_MAG3]|nr:MAG: NB-ARC domain-containing protein [Planktothrix sp. GU0601_MAG3]
MDTERIVESIKQIVYQKSGKYLKDIQVDILREVLNNNNQYRRIAGLTNATEDIIKKQASLLWQLLSQVFDEKVTKFNVKAVLDRSLSSIYPAKYNTREDWADVPDVSYFLGRETDLNTLKQWVIQDHCRLVSVVGLPGKGKTNLSVKLAEAVKGEFEGVIWRSLFNAPPIQEIIKDWILFLSHQEKADLPDSLEQQIALLIAYLKQHRYLLILDNIEKIIATETHIGKYKPGYEDYQQLLEKIAVVSHQSCLILNSRVKISHLEKSVGQHQPVRFFLLGGLTIDQGKQLFKEKGEFFASETEWETLINFYQGNPLALKLTACHVQSVFAGNIKEFLNTGNLFFEGLRELLDWHFEASCPEENQILFWLAIHGQPVSILELKPNLISVLTQHHLSDYLESLHLKMLLEKIENQHYFTLQSVLIEYITQKFIITVTQELITGEFNLFKSHALMVATSKDDIRNSKIRKIINPIVDSLLEQFKTQQNLETHLKYLLLKTQEQYPLTSGYIRENLINLLRHLPTNLKSCNFSDLTLEQTNLQGVNLQKVNFSNCYLESFDFCAI